MILKPFKLKSCMSCAVNLCDQEFRADSEVRGWTVNKHV